MDQQTITFVAVAVIVLMGALLVGTEVAQNLRHERELDEQQEREEIGAGQGELPADEEAATDSASEA
jgi:hypothetical protein